MTDGQYFYLVACGVFAAAVVLEHVYIKWRNKR